MRMPSSNGPGCPHFQPDAVTISRGDEWRERRRFNESVLATGHGLHQYAKLS